MSNDTQFYTHKTLASWDEAAALHAQINQHLIHDVQDPSFNHLDDALNRLLGASNLTDKSVVQICCNNGIDLLSVKNKGAGYCLGIDGSAEFIKQATAYAYAAKQDDIEFACHNIYALPNSLHEKFDCAFMTVGVINWMPDLADFFNACASLLKPGGEIFLEEIHPILGMYEEGEPSYIHASYFNKNPHKDENGLDYFTGNAYSAKENYWFQHTIADVLTAAIQAGLTLTNFMELPYNLGNFCADLESSPHNPPLAMVASWKKTK